MVKSKLTNLCKVVFGVLVEDKFSDWNQWKVCMRPNFCQIKRVERKLFGLLECHHLNEHGVRRKVSFGNGIVKITNGKVRIVSRHVVCLLPIKAFDTLICLVMKLRKNPLKLRTILRKAKRRQP